MRKKVLISAYACEPERGSESAVGWNWALQMARFYEVVVVTRESRKAPIEKFFKDQQGGLENLSFEYLDLPNWVIKLKRGSVLMNFYYMLWQIAAFFRARRLVSDGSFALVHHVSFMSLTRGCFAPFLGIPSIVGPVGGLQTVPEGCRNVIKSKLVEKIRNLGVRYFRFNPLGRIAVERADTLVLANATNSEILPDRILAKSVVGLQIGTDLFPPRTPEYEEDRFTFRWIGRMIDHKGFEILIETLSKLKETRPDLFPRIRVLVSGSGPLKAKYRAQIEKLDLEDAFEFLGWLSVEEMDQLWNVSQVFLFTSLRETTGLALLEAMIKEVPPIVVANGGPAEIVNDECGYRIEVTDYQALLKDYAETMVRCIEAPAATEALGKKARERVLAHYTWEAVGDRMHEIYEDLLDRCDQKN